MSDQEMMRFEDMTDAAQVIERLRRANVLKQYNIAWPDENGNVDVEVAAVLLEYIKDEATEDSVKDRLKYAGIDTSVIDLDYLTNLFEEEHFKS